MVRFTPSRTVASALALSVGLLSAGAAVAQDQPTTVADSTQSDATRTTATDNGIAGDITVTARKRGESIIDAPLAITALSSESLEQKNITDLNTLNGNIPGFRYQNTTANRNDRGFVNFTIRGMSVPVTVFVDGVAIPTGSIPGLNNIERVEVVNGPQSAYFGRATFAGAVNFITKSPSLDAYHASADALYNSRNKIDANASVEGPIIEDKLSIRISGRYYNKQGEYKNYNGTGRLGDESTKSVAVNLLAKPTNDITVRGYYSAWRDSDGPSAQAALTEADYNCNAGGTAPLINGKNYYCGSIGSVPFNRLSQNNTPPYAALQLAKGQSAVAQDLIDHLGLERRAYQANLLADWQFGHGWTLSANGGISHNQWGAITDTYNRGNDGTGYSSTVFIPNDDVNKTVEGRISSPKFSGLSFLVGTNYIYAKNTFVGRAFRPTTSSNISELSRLTVGRSFTTGIFGAINYDILPGLTISGEGRYQWDDIRQDIDFSNTHLQNTFKSFTPRVILNYEMNRDINLYASYAEGRRPGTFNGGLTTLPAGALPQILAQFPVPLAVPEERLRNWEVGVKGNFFDRKVTLLAAGYYGNWTGRQISQNIAYLIGTTSQTNTFILPSGKTDIWGLELQSTYRVTPNLTLDGTFDWAATRIVSTSCSECVLISGVLNPVGNQMERYPATSGSFNATYEEPINARWTSFLRGHYIYTGKMYDTAANVAWTAPSHVINFEVGARTDTFSLEVFVRNLTKNEVPINILRNANPNASAAQGRNLIILAPPERPSIGIRAIVRY